MSKFHVNANGNPGTCSANTGNCPFGGDEVHFSSKDDARTYYELSQKIAAIPTIASVSKKNNEASEKARRIKALKAIEKDYSSIKSVGNHLEEDMQRYDSSVKMEYSELKDSLQKDEWLKFKDYKLENAVANLKNSRSGGSAYKRRALLHYNQCVAIEANAQIVDRISAQNSNRSLENEKEFIDGKIQHMKNINAIEAAARDDLMIRKVAATLGEKYDTVTWVLDKTEDNLFVKKTSKKSLKELSANPGIILKKCSGVTEENVKEILRWASHYNSSD